MPQSNVTPVLILGVSLLVAAIILSLGMNSLGKSIERAGGYARGTTSVNVPKHLSLSLGSNAILLRLQNQGSDALKVELQQEKTDR